MTQHDKHDARREQILSGALQAFAEKGYRGASNRDIAAAAGLNTPALLYHYFENKQALFEAVIETFMPTPQLLMNPGALATMPVDEVLKQIAATILATFADPKTRALMRVMLSEGLHTSEVSEAIFQGGSQKILSFMYGYLDGLMAAGVIKRVDLGAALRSFMGPFAAHVINDYLLTIPDERTPDSQIMIDTAVMIFLNGLDYKGNSQNFLTGIFIDQSIKSGEHHDNYR